MIMAGILGVLELASLTICMSIYLILFRVPLGITEATGALLGNSIGANNVRLAKRFALLIVKVSFIFIFFLCALTVFLHEQITGFFSDDETVCQMTKPVLIILVCGFIFDGMQGVLRGPILTLGLAPKGSIVALVVWWIIALPLSALLAFKLDLGIIGLMLGFITAFPV